MQVVVPVMQMLVEQVMQAGMELQLAAWIGEVSVAYDYGTWYGDAEARRFQ